MRKLLMVLCIAVLLSACAPRYDAALLTSIEGRWMCDVQRYAFDTPTDIQTELENRLAGDGVSIQQYQHFKRDLASRITLRNQVQTAYEQACVS